MIPLDGPLWGALTVQAAVFLAVAIAGLGLALVELRAAWADATWRRRVGLNGVGALVAASAVTQEVFRVARMLLYGAAVATVVFGWPHGLVGLLLIVAVVLDTATSLDKGRVRRTIRRIEAERLGDVVHVRPWDGTERRGQGG